MRGARGIAVVVLVALAGALPYLGLLDAGFLGLDDPYFITRLRLWREPSLDAALEVVRAPVFGAWHPLHQLSYLVDRLVWGPTPFGVRLGQALLHGACAAATVGLARRLGLAPVAAAAAGLAFAWHPAHAENVAWPSQRKDLLSCLFLALSLAAWHGPARGPRRGLTTLALLALALLAKGSASVGAAMLAASSLATGRARRDAPWLACALALALGATAVHYRAQRDLGGAVAPPASRLAHARQVVRALDYYAVTALAPVGLSPAPPAPPPTLGPADVRAVVVVLAGAAGLAAAWRRRGRSRAFLLSAWWVLALLPIVGLVPGPMFVQDRYLLVPSLGLAIGLGDALAAAGRRAPRRRRTLLAAAGAVLVAGALASARVAESWRSDRAMWRRAVEVAPDDAAALARLATATLQAHAEGDPGAQAEGERLARAAVRLSPGSSFARQALAEALLARGAAAEARQHLEAVAGSSANTAFQAAVRLVVLDVLADDLAAAAGHLALAERRAPATRPEVDSAAALLAVARGRPPEAAAALRRAVEAMPSWDDAWGRLADAERLAGDARAAEAAAARADAARAGAVRAHLALDAGRPADAARLLDGPVGDTLEGGLARARLLAAGGDPAGARRALAALAAREGAFARRRAALEPDLRPLLD